MAVKESSFLSLLLSLFIIAFVGSVTLAVVHNLTKDKIAAVQKEKKLKAIKTVLLPGFTNSPDIDQFTITLSNDKIECYPAKINGSITSYAIKSYSNKAFNGNITIMIGVLPDGQINKISIVKQGETPGLGTKILKNKFLNQFIGIKPSDKLIKVKKDGGNIDAITAATITSRAFCDAINRAFSTFKKIKMEHL